jgi:hypothetical protein
MRNAEWRCGRSQRFCYLGAKGPLQQGTGRWLFRPDFVGFRRGNAGVSRVYSRLGLTRIEGLGGVCAESEAERLATERLTTLRFPVKSCGNLTLVGSLR